MVYTTTTMQTPSFVTSVFLVLMLMAPSRQTSLDGLDYYLEQRIELRRLQTTEEIRSDIPVNSSPACGQTFFNSSVGLITSPGWPSRYPHNMHCAYTIEAEPNQVIRLTYNHLKLEGYENEDIYLELDIYTRMIKFDGHRDMICKDFITISFIDGHNSRYCESFQNIERYSADRSVAIHFQSNGQDYGYEKDNPETGFKITYEAVSPDPACGQTYFSGSHGVITSPGWPNEYPPNLDCIYTIEAEQNHFIKLTYNHLDLENWEANCWDFITMSVIDIIGIDSSAGGWEKNCTSPQVSERYSLNNLITINFQSDESISGTGFMITYESLSQHQLCGQTFFNGSDGEIKSPRWPYRYGPNMNCTYTIEAPYGQIWLNYSSLDLQRMRHYNRTSNRMETICYDYITLSFINGGSSRYCGMTQSIRQNSMTNRVTINFRSDETGSRSGFLIKYYDEARYQGGELSNREGGETGFSNYEEGEGPCEELELIGFIFPYDLSRIPWTYSCEEKVAMMRELNSGRIRYWREKRATGSINNNNAPWSNKSSQFCGQTFFNGSHGEIKSPRLPNRRYRLNMNCTYTIEAEHGQVIWLKYNRLNLVRGYHCPSWRCERRCIDYITLSFINGSSSRFCEKDQTMEQNSMTNLVTITFHSGGHSPWFDFLITYGHEAFSQEPACGQTFFNSSEGVITSPGWPNRYPAHFGCTYTIEAEHNQVIRLTYNHLNLQHFRWCNHERCKWTCFDYISMSFTNGSYNRYCSTRQSIEQNSMNNLVTIHFNSQLITGFTSTGFTAGTGFNITYEALSSDQM